MSATDTDIYLLCPDAVECYGYDGVQNWVYSDLASRPLAVVNAAKPLLFTAAGRRCWRAARSMGCAPSAVFPCSRKLPLIFEKEVPVYVLFTCTYL